MIRMHRRIRTEYTACWVRINTRGSEIALIIPRELPEAYPRD
jgi:hypothetical protein